ncbi:hypothetical protein [Streptomyces sp. SAS_270]
MAVRVASAPLTGVDDISDRPTAPVNLTYAGPMTVDPTPLRSTT